ncbi:FKBP-type peptidyl-prolyl cis-trans isomerase [Hellea balneolensis]|uniref:FKBP-type peptidyl-prolyl cis-trans isomerase n=1 Tax=Hellea balneolensis TaxID=287478 RepID=UPI0004225183|nr:FKBP-type peptidyl-prolyl cis-trans isomerase [Hellea balneolensis]
MTVKHLFAATACLTLIACSGGTSNESSAPIIEASDGTGPSVCPSERVITDVAAYAGDQMPAASEDYAAWHEANGKRRGVVTLESGLQYKIIKPGVKNGPSPVGPQVIRANYHGYFPNGEVFDSSYERNEPLEYKANAFIKGWNEALTLMQPCSAWILYVPGDIAYGPRGRPGIPPNATLVFNMQLLEVK